MTNRAGLVPIDQLPRELDELTSVERVYREDLDWIEAKITQGLSVLVECDKQLTFWVYRALRARIRRRSGADARGLRLVTGHATPGDARALNLTTMQRMIRELRDAVFSGETNDVIVLPHLDVLTTTTRSGLTGDSREAAALLFENPDVTYLGFKDPNFDLPRVIVSAFAVRHAMIGMPRKALPRVILQREARKLAVDAFNPYALYKYVSGLNAVRLRQILSHFHERLDYDPQHPESADQIVREIRQMTLVGELELPEVDLHADIGGYDAVKEQLESEVLELLRLHTASTDPGAIRDIEEIIPKGLILYGPPGTGKTFFAKAIATSLDATITIVSGPELKSRWVGESEENLRRVFTQARRSAPSVIVFDELDSFATERGTYTGSGVEHSMVNQLLTEMDGFRKEELVFVVGTTNRAETLDPALLRPGRFELKIEVGYPGDGDRRAIAAIYAARFGLTLSSEVMEYVVMKTGGFVDAERNVRFSGDHLYAIARALKREHLRRGGAGTFTPTRQDVDDAIRLRKASAVSLTASERRTIAVHEAGHAICAYVLPHCPTIDSVTIATDDTDTLGYVLQAVRDNRYVTTQRELLDDICVMLGGRSAERLVLKDASVGAYDDLRKATTLARMMIEELGMSDALGLRSFASGARPGGERPRIADRTAARIDTAIEKLLAEQRDRAVALLGEHRTQLDQLVSVLLDKQTVGVDAIAALFDGRNFKNTEGADA